MAFSEDETEATILLKRQFPNALIQPFNNALQQSALSLFTQDWSNISQIKLHLKGSDFQLKVWDALLKIPMGHLSTYGQIAQRIHQPSASRAVGTAIGSNPVAYLIPCHRVIQSGGLFGNYMWGAVRKTAIIGWEAAKAANYGSTL